MTIGKPMYTVKHFKIYFPPFIFLLHIIKTIEVVILDFHLSKD